MNAGLLEELLNEDESATLDFKRAQYPFRGATDEQKAELLKDVLAMANAWRRATAYILVGVEEITGGRSKVVGVTAHLSDNELQQFINSKTARPVVFSYTAFSYEGAQLGIIEIPVQPRPSFLTKAFGKLEANTVYLRRGSSTDIADPEEVARMGVSDASNSDDRVPAFELLWADPESQKPLGTSINVPTVVLVPKLEPKQIMPPRGPYDLVPGFYTPGKEYYRRLIDYIHDEKFLFPLGFLIQNTSGVAAQDVVVKCIIDKIEGVRLHDYSGRPIMPSQFDYMISVGGRSVSALPEIRNRLIKDPDPEVREFPSHWELTIPFGTVRPKASVWSTDVVYLGSERTMDLLFPLEVYAINLPTPQCISLQARIDVFERRAMKMSDIPLGAVE